jgi:hypothetical protein
VTHEYKIQIERDGRWWMVHIPELDGLTQARRLSEAELMGREWIAVSTGTPLNDVTVNVTSITVPGMGDVQRIADDLIHLRELAAQADRDAQNMASSFVDELTAAEVPVRDAGELLHLSPQRISQLANLEPDATLFEESGRSDNSAARHTEGAFHFLNRRAGGFWDRVRGHIESSYAAFPDEHKHGLVARLRKNDERQHLPAWWELYTFTLFDKLGYKIEVHPELPGSPKNPDFLVTKGHLSMYVEAAVVFNGQQDADAWNWVCDCVNAAKNPDFMVDLDIITQGKQRPAKLKIIDPLEKWLATLDADQVLADLNTGRPLPHTQLAADDWILDYTAAPVLPNRRGIPRRLIAIYPTRPATFSQDVDQLRKTLNKKGANYSKLDNAPLDRPLITAITSWSSLDESELREALFGPRSGYWRNESDPRGTRMSAVLFGNTMRAWRAADQLPELWLNPWATNPLHETEPFATVTTDDGVNSVRTPASTTAAAVFGLAPGWPNGA